MKRITLRRAASSLVLCAALLVLVTVVSPLTALANDINGVEMHMQIHEDGSATITERWQINMTNSSNTEFYVAKYNLDNMDILNLQVTEILDDGTEVLFETLSRWDVNANRSQKAGKAGLVRASGGYEVCWGFGELGNHTYVIQYTITNVVKGYEGGDAMSYNFLSDAAGGSDYLNITLEAENFEMEYPATRVWVYGFEAESEFEEGGITITGQGRFYGNDYSAVLLVFDPGLLSPTDVRSDSVEDIIALNMEGSIWEPDYNGNNGGNYSGNNNYYNGNSFGGFSIFRLLIFSPLLPLVLIMIAFGFIRKSGSSGSKEKRAVASGQYANVDYCRELPFEGNLAATYTRLYALGQVDEGAIIGCHLLQWVRNGQVEIVKETTGVIRKKEEDAIKLNPPQPGMSSIERRLYDMLVAAAGSDSVLQNKEFEKWARKRYSSVESFLYDYRSAGNNAMDRMGAYAVVPVKKFFGLIDSKQRQITNLGEELTRKMFGFLKFLQDFTIINEREAREVQLWDEYLIYAQLFGIADQVAEQFKNLYPDFFVRPDQVYGGYSTVDILVATHISRSFSRSMYNGYRAGYNAAHSSSSSSGGGGGSSSGGGGGGSSGGGGAGGR